MMKSELIELLKVDDIKSGDYTKLELWYLALDLDKPVFAKIVQAVGIDTLTARAGHADEILQAMTDYDRKQRYQQAKRRLNEIKVEADQLAESVKAYEDANRIMPDDYDY